MLYLCRKNCCEEETKKGSGSNSKLKDFFYIRRFLFYYLCNRFVVNFPPQMQFWTILKLEFRNLLLLSIFKFATSAIILVHSAFSGVNWKSHSKIPFYKSSWNIAMRTNDFLCRFIRGSYSLKTSLKLLRYLIEQKILILSSSEIRAHS